MRRGADACAAALLVAAACAGKDEQHFAREPREPVSSTNYEIEHRLRVPIPPGARRVRIWFTRPQDEPTQTVRHFNLQTNVRPFAEDGKDSSGNTYLFWDIKKPVIGAFTATVTCMVTRREQRSGATASRTWPYSEKDYRPFRDELAIEDEGSRELAADILDGELNPVHQAKLLYRWVLDRTDHYAKDPTRLRASGRGSAVHVRDHRAGGADDLAAYFVELARAGGLPARLVYGSLFKAALDGADRDQGWHCWAEFHAPGLGWVPVDVAIADVFEGNFELTTANEEAVDLATATGYHGASPRRVEYYFGNVDDRRVTWSRGRRLELRPGRVGPVDAMPVAHVDVDGEPSTDFERTLTYRIWREK